MVIYFLLLPELVMGDVTDETLDTDSLNLTLELSSDEELEWCEEWLRLKSDKFWMIHKIHQYSKIRYFTCHCEHVEVLMQTLWSAAIVAVFFITRFITYNDYIWRCKWFAFKILAYLIEWALTVGPLYVISTDPNIISPISCESELIRFRGNWLPSLFWLKRKCLMM